MESILAKVCSKHKELGRDWNEIEFRLGAIKGKAFQPDIGMVDFDMIVKRYKGIYPFSSAHLLSISTSGMDAAAKKNTVVRISDPSPTADKIRAYCLSDGKLDKDMEIYTKEKISLDLDGYPLRVSFGEETPVPMEEVDIKSGNKFYRFARRFSFFVGGLGNTGAGIRLDCSIVKQGSGKDLRSSGVLDKAAEEFFEVELELAGFKGRLADYSKELGEALMPLVLAYQGGMHLETSGTLVKAMNDYFANCKKTMSIGAGAPIEVQTVSPIMWDEGTMNAIMKYYFLPDVPEVLSYDDYSKITDPKEYCVTDKADGIRAMLYIARDGMPYVISKTSIKRKGATKNALKIMPTGLAKSGIPVGTLLDGEFLEEGDRRTYMCFDIVFGFNEKGESFKGEELPFWEGRYKYLTGLFAGVPSGSGAFRLALKQFIRCWLPEYQGYLANNIVNRAGVLHYQSGNREFDYELDGLIFQKANDPYPAKGQKWFGTYKWKPLNQISVDFKLAAPKTRVVVPAEQIGAPAGGKYLGLTPMYSVGTGLKADPHMCYSVLVKDIPRTLDSDEPIAIGDIVECRMITNASKDSYWQPMRLRRDKVFPNGEMAWKSNVNSILRPVTFDMLVNRAGGGESPASVDENIMRKINKVNRSISTEHIVTYGKDREFPRVLEIAVGSGQSCKAWNLIRAQEILGVDLIPDILAETSLRNKYFMDNATYVKKPVTNYYTADMTTLLHQPQIGVEPGLMKQLAVPDRYDIAVCNFAIHYAFRSKQALSNFLTNVARNIKPGSYFVGSYMSGLELDRLMKEGPVTKNGKTFTTDGSAVTYRNGDVKLWEVKYTGPRDGIYDNKIEVAIIKRPYSYEYWIDLSSKDVQKVFLEHGLEFIRDEQFKSPTGLDEADKIWVGVHHKFVFRKVAEKPAETNLVIAAPVEETPVVVEEAPAPKKRVIKKKEVAPPVAVKEKKKEEKEDQKEAPKKRVLKRKVTTN